MVAASILYVGTQMLSAVTPNTRGRCCKVQLVHGLHVACPGLGWNETPAIHEIGGAAPPPHRYPAGQGAGVAEPPLQNDPDGHATGAVAPPVQ